MQAFFHAMGGLPPQMGIGEIPLHSGAANHWRGVESVGGWLHLTNQRLLFTPHSVAIQAQPSSIDLFQIAAVEAGASLWIIPNQLVVVTKTGRREKFVVQGREQWVEMIRAHVQHSPYGR